MKDNQMKQAEREAFEQTRLKVLGVLDQRKNVDGSYIDHSTQKDWLMWQAKLTTSQVSEPVADGYFYTSLSGEKCHFFGDLHESTKRMVEAGDITELRPFYFKPSTILLFDKDDECKVTLSNTPLYQQAYDLIQSIEGLGASSELTAVVTQAGKLADEIVKRELNFHHVWKAFNELNAPTLFGEPLREAWMIYYDGSDGHPADYMRPTEIFNSEYEAKQRCQRAAYQPRKVFIYATPTTPQEAISPAIAEYVKALEISLEFTSKIYKETCENFRIEPLGMENPYQKILASKPTGLE